jgi:Na+-driven multidrug efflux pump
VTPRHQDQNKSAHFFSLIKQSLRGIEHDYTQGSIRSAIALLAVPMILELSLESVFAVVDMFFVGRLGANAIAAVGLTELAITIVYSIAIGLSTATTAVVARRIGEKDPDGAAHAGMQSILLAFIITVIISSIGLIFAPEILHLMGASDDVVKEGAIFTRIMLGGSIVIILLFLIRRCCNGHEKSLGCKFSEYHPMPMPYQRIWPIS